MTNDHGPTDREIPEDLSQRTHRLIIGGLGFFLPMLVYVLAGIRPTDGLVPWDLLESVSAYYYTGAVGVFVGVVFSLSLFLFSYRGYKEVGADRAVGKLGGAAAVVVALCPVGAPRGASEPAWWTHTIGITHYVAAVMLFLSFILFSVWLFRKSSIPNRRDRPREKRFRDGVCLACGLIMIVSVLWAGASSFKNASIFVPEAIAIEAFAISWLVKGEAHRVFLAGFRSIQQRAA